MVSGANEGIDRKLSCFAYSWLFAEFETFWNHFKFEKENRASGRTKSHPVVENLEDHRSARKLL